MKKFFSKRVLLKISGEVFAGKSRLIDFARMCEVAREVKELQKKKIQVAMVIGGGNIWRYRDFQDIGLPRVTSDTQGMLATVMNSVVMKSALEKVGSKAMVFSAIPVARLTEPYNPDAALEAMNQGKVVILAGGTGNPYFTTDSAAALRALELKANVLLKATKVDYVYDKDPQKYADAKAFKKITYSEVLQKNLAVMDAAAIALCRDGSLPIVVFNVEKRGAIIKVGKGQNIGTKIHP